MLKRDAQSAYAVFSILIVFAVALFVLPQAAAAQAAPALAINEDQLSDMPEPSHDEWRQRVKAAKQRAKEIARVRREYPELFMRIPEDPETEASERVLNDDSLQRGDIIVTKKGMFVYQGRKDWSDRAGDFVPIDPKPAR